MLGKGVTEKTEGNRRVGDVGWGTGEKVGGLKQEKHNTESSEVGAAVGGVCGKAVKILIGLST